MATDLVLCVDLRTFYSVMLYFEYTSVAGTKDRNMGNSDPNITPGAIFWRSWFSFEPEHNCEYSAEAQEQIAIPREKGFHEVVESNSRAAG